MTKSQKDSFVVTADRLQKWTASDGVPRTAWELRRIFGASEYFNVIAQGAMVRDKKRNKQITWKEWWAFRLERLDEQVAANFLMEAWVIDVPEFIRMEAMVNATAAIQGSFSRVKVAAEFDEIFKAWEKELEKRGES